MGDAMNFNALYEAVTEADRRADVIVRWRRGVGCDVAQLETARQRIATGCRISFCDGEFRVHDEWGAITMMTSDPAKALNRYFFQCSLATQQAELARRSDCLGLTPVTGKW